MDLKQLAKRKLEEFHRWCRVSNLFHEPTESFDNELYIAQKDMFSRAGATTWY